MYCRCVPGMSLKRRKHAERMASSDCRRSIQTLTTTYCNARLPHLCWAIDYIYQLMAVANYPPIGLLWVTYIKNPLEQS